MRETVLKIMSVVILSFLGENLLPEGNMKKYAATLLSVIICLCLISALYGEIKLNITEFPESCDTEINDTFEGEVLADYKKRAETEIEKNCGAKPEITVNGDGSIAHVLFYGAPRDTSYLTKQMGVSENEIEISDR